VEQEKLLYISLTQQSLAPMQINQGPVAKLENLQDIQSFDDH
jgi:hypothetical protein